ncbi:raffinose/stachyose/melibiose transport system substrate-binding protein [Amphibacillus marinus]|uniref:Raffinose/stachyose/melibiose transport system substrate-binding protein n=1 Tax=Amphibacillus marinus TaxID=872970 RepID=A0A1H8RB12_9BACI|nr:extracellular solute-binding protein [Amphibacillus marinus]SEO63590.1 raffinose/stachyose/melibiose transport system substrate-binding protein [Amphibacillus marinus]
MLKKLGFLMLLVMTVVGLIACGSNGTDKNESVSNDGGTDTDSEAGEDALEPVEIVMMYAIGDAQYAQAVAGLLEDFQNEYPHITIVENNSGTGSYLETMTTADAVGEFPDIMEMRDTQLFADAGKLAPIPEELHSLFPELPEINGEYYVAPGSAQMPLGIMYNKDIFEELSLEIPTTLDEFEELSLTIKESGVSPIVVGGGDLWHMAFWINKFLIDHLYADNPDWHADRVNGEVSWADENVVEAFTELKSIWDQDLVDSGWLSTPDNQTISLLTTERAAMLYSGVWMINQIIEANPDFNLGFFALPDTEGNISTVGLPAPAGWALSTEAAQDEAKVDAYVKFIEYMFAEENYEPFLAATSGVSSTHDQITYDAPEAFESALEVYNDPSVTKSLMINQFYGDNLIPPQFRDYFYKVIQEVLLEQYSIEDALEQVDREWDVLYEAWQAE